MPIKQLWALFLLLVFQIEASYYCYDELHKTWTKMIINTKALAQVSITWIQQPKNFD
jgi:predicted membrane chloride channel (bestrophin family)